MTSTELLKFLEDCIVNDVKLPKDNTLLIILDDFDEFVPEEHHDTPKLEYCHHFDNMTAKVIVIPERALQETYRLPGHQTIIK